MPRPAGVLPQASKIAHLRVGKDRPANWLAQPYRAPVQQQGSRIHTAIHKFQSNSLTGPLRDRRQTGDLLNPQRMVVMSLEEPRIIPRIKVTREPRRNLHKHSGWMTVDDGATRHEC